LDVIKGCHNEFSVGMLIWRDQLIPSSKKLRKKEKQLSNSNYQKKIQFVANVQKSPKHQQKIE
jgi:hypothetical protein